MCCEKLSPPLAYTYVCLFGHARAATPAIINQVDTVKEKSKCIARKTAK